MSRPRRTSAEPSVGPSAASATPARSVGAAGAMGGCGLNDGAGVATPRGSFGPTTGADVAAGDEVAGGGDDTAARRLVSESSWKNTMLTGTYPPAVSTKFS